MIALGCVTGRFQPVHLQHLELLAIALQRCREVVVAVTNPHGATGAADPHSPHRHTAAANPFTYEERVLLLQAALDERGWAGRCHVVPFDLDDPADWPRHVPLSAHQFVRVFSAWEREKARRLAAAGYGVTVIEGEPARKLSSSEIRAALAHGDEAWRNWVPPATVPLLQQRLVRQPVALSP